MKLIHERVTPKSEKAVIAILLAFLFASVLLALAIVFLLNYLFTGNAV